MFKIQYIPFWHALETHEEVRHICVYTDVYRARWEQSAPDRILVYAPEADDVQPEWMTLTVGAWCEAEDAPHLPDPASFEAPFRWDPENFRIQNLGDGENVSHTLAFTAKSSAGGVYEYRVVFFRDRIVLEAEYRFEGTLTLRRARLASRGGVRRSFIDADAVFNPNPGAHGMQYSGLHVPVTTGSTGDWWFSPAPFCFPIRVRGGSWMSVFPAPSVDELLFTGFSTDPGGPGEIGFSLDYTSGPEFTGEYRFPPLVFRFGAADPFAALKDHADTLVSMGRLEPPRREAADWWHGVMTCGWSAQEGGNRGCTQQAYEKYVARLDEAGIDWDILTIDDFWGPSHGVWEVNTERWPDLPGFIRRCHEKGRRVLLWVCVWPAGLPDDEVYVTGKLRFLDPHNPKYIRRLERCCERMFGHGPDDLDADGIKLDFTGQVPLAGPAQCTDRLYGMQYLYELYRLIHDTAKRVKPDCLLDLQVANPYFAPLYDMTRLNDFFLPEEIAVPVMRTRAQIAHAVGFGALVDTDHPNTEEYYRTSHTFGNMSLYLTNKVFSDPVRLDAIRETIREIKG